MSFSYFGNFKTKHMEVEYNALSGHPNTVWDSLNRKVSAYKGANKFVKVGITGRNPQQRFNEHLLDKQWKRMIVIYQTTSIKYANQMENWLVSFHYEDLVNVRQGGGSNLSEVGWNYVYILLA